RRDANKERMRVFTDALKVAQEKYFDKVYGDDHFYLGLLATHPDYQRRGAGTMLCKVGLDIADKHNSHISVFCSPMGHPLYLHLGWRDVATVTVQVEREDEKLVIPAMIYNGQKKDGNKDKNQ